MKIFKVGNFFKIFISMLSLYCVHVRHGRNSPYLQGCSLSCNNDMVFDRVHIRHRQI